MRSPKPIAVPVAPSPPRATRQAPCVRGLPIVGVAARFLRDPIGLLGRVAAEHPGEIVALPLGPRRAYLVTEPRHVQHILVDRWRNYGKGPMWKATRSLMGNGLVTSEGEDWVRSRRIMQPIFSARNVASLVPILAAAARREAGRLLTLADRGATVDMADEMMGLVQRLFLEGLFGADAPAEVTRRLGAAIVRALRAINTRVFLYFLPAWVPRPGERALARDLEIIDSSILGLVQHRRGRDQGGPDLLSLLLGARADGAIADDRQLRDELVAMFVAGYDTTAVAMAWLWHELDEHPEVTARLRAELRQVLGDRLPTAADLTGLPFTRAVIQETMRLHPVGWILPRVAIAPDIVDGYAIPAGADILMSEYVTHRSAVHWDRPDIFDASRFTETAPMVARHRLAHFPFSAGPRACIGAQVALSMLQVMLAALVPHLRATRAPGTRVEPELTVTMRPRGGLPMRLDRVTDA